MKNNLKSPKLIGAIIVVVIAVLGTVAFAVTKDDKKTADNKPTQTTEQTKKDDAKVEAASTTTPSESTPATDTESTPAATTASTSKPATVKTAVATTSAAPAAPQPAVTQPQVPATEPETPVTQPETPVEEPTEYPCIVEGTVAIPVGGSSCSIYVGTQDGFVTTWHFPELDDDAPVKMVIDSESLAGPDEPYTNDHVIFHYEALSTATPGTYRGDLLGLASTVDVHGGPFGDLQGYRFDWITLLDNAIVSGDQLDFTPHIF